MKALRIVGVAMVLMTAIVGIATAAQTELEKVDLEMVDGVSAGYRVNPTKEIVDFLAHYGIDLGLEAKELGRAIGALSTTQIENADAEELYSLGDKLNWLVNSALAEVNREITDSVFMDIGTLRWVIPHTED